MIPITVNLAQDRGPKRTFHFEVVNDQLFTPLMTYAALPWVTRRMEWWLQKR